MSGVTLWSIWPLGFSSGETSGVGDGGEWVIADTGNVTKAETMKADDLRQLRRATKAIKGIKRDLAEMFAPSPRDTVKYLPGPAQTKPHAKIPQNYSYVLCVDCDAPALLVRDTANACYAALCLYCSTITHLEAIIEDKGYVAGKKQ